MEDIRALVLKYYEKMIEYRRHIHRHPELSGEEKQTAAFIAARLREMGLEPTENVGGYGVTAVIEGCGEGKCIGLRADIDALPITETTGCSFASENAGVSHSCGHDCHTAMLLGCAHVLMETRDSWKGKVKLIFQPAEESVLSGGAPDMIADGVLENPHVDAIIGSHVWPSIASGHAAIRNGAMMASSDKFFITIKGKASHGSQPENGIDAIVAAAHIVTALQSIVSRSVAPLKSAVVTIGTIEGGDRYNVIADTVKMEGTCRNLDPDVRNEMAGRIEGIIRGVTQALGAEYEFKYCRGYSPTVNDPAMFELVYATMQELLGDKALIPENSALGGEDFSFYGEKIPAAFYWLGTCPLSQDPKKAAPIHNGALDIDEESLTLGVEITVRSALRYLMQ